MVRQNFDEVLAAFPVAGSFTISSLGKGHIHKSYKICPVNQSADPCCFVLQRINTAIFRQPEYIANNWQLTAQYLFKQNPEYQFLRFIPTQSGHYFFVHNQYHWRLLPFLEGEVFEHSRQEEKVFQAAKAFGTFARLTAKIDLSEFNEIIPNFHDATARWKQFTTALSAASPSRIKNAEAAINLIYQFEPIIHKANDLQHKLPKRLQHMDAKLGNVLFTPNQKQPAILLDLDTLMPATILSDTGDMIRSMAANTSEEETNLKKVYINKEMLEAVHEGWMHGLNQTLEEKENKLFYFSGEFIILLQAIRFITDYFLNDQYYPVDHPEHNLNRTMNQLKLLQSLIAIQKDYPLNESCCNLS